MIYLSGGAPNAVQMTEDWGVMLTPDMHNRLRPGAVWGADTTCYLHPERFDGDHFAEGMRWYCAWLAEWTEDQRNACLFATAPDVPYDAEATTPRALAAAPAIRALGYPVALVVQNGHTPRNVPWREFDAIFVGGSVGWKTGEDAVAIHHEARRRGKWTHMGKVNTMRRVMLAKAQGYDSADGTCLKYGSDVNAPRLLAALAHPQMGLGRLGV